MLASVLAAKDIKKAGHRVPHLTEEKVDRIRLSVVRYMTSRGVVYQPHSHKPKPIVVSSLEQLPHSNSVTPKTALALNDQPQHRSQSQEQSPHQAK
ncbi:unnamed protein product [Protopolystoma xenopodis]|uniref:Uncharacterized protein n=1 Tax=Protopolystoma xenopodis TaxID=117903 RepID=A0A3S5BJ51_9PLAT|nr:unnamed protein product [Protopolystoma xenopodis]